LFVFFFHARAFQVTLTFLKSFVLHTESQMGLKTGAY